MHDNYCKYSIKKITNDPAHDKTNKMACGPSEDSGQPGHPPSLISVIIRVFDILSIIIINSCGLFLTDFVT